MGRLYEATLRLREKAEERFQFKSAAYYYCNHSKKSAKLRKEMTQAHDAVLMWDRIIAKLEERRR